jgi:hypothetical protein
MSALTCLRSWAQECIRWFWDKNAWWQKPEMRSEQSSRTKTTGLCTTPCYCVENGRWKRSSAPDYCQYVSILAWIHLTSLQILFWFSRMSMLLTPVETPSIMLLAALRNIRIVRSGLTSIFFRYWLESTGFYFTWFAVPELDQYYIFQPRPTIYNVLLEMTKRMGYEVCLSSNLVSWFSFLSHFHASLHRLDLGFLGPWY